MTVKNSKIFVGKWEEIGITEEMKIALKECGFKKMTPVQKSAVPLFIEGRDLIVNAITGSGKTLAYLVPIIEGIEQKEIEKNKTYAIIVLPTRELSEQVYNQLINIKNKIKSKEGIEIVLANANIEKVKQLEILKEVKKLNIIIGTPSRVVYLIMQNLQKVNLNHLEYLIFDEADKLLEMGYTEDLKKIIEKCPNKRKTGLFSSTIPEKLTSLSLFGQKNPLKIDIKLNKKGQEHSIVPLDLKILYNIIPGDQKLSYLLEKLKSLPKKKIIVYFSTCHIVEYLYNFFINCLKYENLYKIHRKMWSSQRKKTINEISNRDSWILFSTDLTSRGLDFDSLDLVIHFDLPRDPESFIHRCGRTARLGKPGSSYIFILPNEDAYLGILDEFNIKYCLDPEIFEKINFNAEEALKSYNMECENSFKNSKIAFVSYIEYYKRNQTNLICDLNKLDLNAIVKLFGLIQLPKMNELKGKKIDLQISLPNQLLLNKKNHNQKERKKNLIRKKANI